MDHIFQPNRKNNSEIAPFLKGAKYIEGRYLGEALVQNK